MSAVVVGALILAWSLFVGVVLGWLAGPALFARLGKPEKHGWTAPAVTEMIAQGWKVGTPRGEAEQLSSPV